LSPVQDRPSAPAKSGNERFFLRSAIVMTLVIVTAFSMQVVLGRSSFASPPRVHVHAVLFMGWVAIYLLQNILVSAGRIDLHRKLGWIASIWMVAMIVSAMLVTTAIVRAGTVPFFIQPQHFLIFDYVGIIAFAVLTAAAILLRRRTEWHRRLHFCGMTILIQPAFGRLLPMPFLQPWAWEASLAVALMFPVFGMRSDMKRSGRVHSAWLWGVGAIIATFAMIEAVTYSPVGSAIYEAVTNGSPGAKVPALEFQPAPEGPLTGRS
jgi:hypothetical protein